MSHLPHTFLALLQSASAPSDPVDDATRIIITIVIVALVMIAVYLYVNRRRKKK